MRNYTLRIVKGSSLFSLLIITLWVLPVCASCKLENPDNPSQIQDDNVPLPRNQEVVEGEEIPAEETWICVVCRSENGQHEAMCCQCNAVRQQANQKQPQEDKKEDNNLEEEEDLNQVDPNKDQCPVCLDWFTKEQQAACKYWTCDHFVCESCYGNIKSAKKLHDYCPTCRCQILRPKQSEREEAQHPSN